MNAVDVKNFEPGHCDFFGIMANGDLAGLKPEGYLVLGRIPRLVPRKLRIARCAYMRIMAA
jgi:hypothetical protein